MSNKQKLPPPFATLRQPVNCAISGAVLGVLEVSIVEGNVPFVQNFSDVQLLHPFFGQSDYNLMRKFDESLRWFAEHGWQNDPVQILRVQIIMSATMHKLGVLKQESPSLPNFAITAGCAHRLYSLAKWYLLETSKRAHLPLFSVARRNSNLEWENFRFWLDEFGEIRERWRSKASEIEREAELRSRETALKDIMSAHTRKVSLKNVWGWIELQLKMSVRDGRLETWKAVFMTGDLAPEDWLPDDVDDLAEAITEHCDIGNEIMYFVHNRLQFIREQITEFYGSFTIVKISADSPQFSQSEKESELMREYDDRVQLLETLPPPPQQKDFATLVLFLKAQAQYNILKSRFELLRKKGDQK